MDLAALHNDPGFRRLFRRRAAYRSVFKGPDGEAVLRDLLKFCGVGQTSHIPGDPHTTAYNEGMRRVALRITGFINMSETRMAALAQRTEDEHG